MITRALIEETLIDLRKQRANGLAQAEQAFGAITLAEYLLAQIVDEEPPKEPETEQTTL